MSNVIFSNNDLRLNIKLPKNLDSDLAYLLGIQIGDGYLKKYKRKTAIEYLISYDGHYINEKEWYDLVLKVLIKKLFNKDVPTRITTTGTVNISFRSKAVFTFLHTICKISVSPKKNIRIPDYIFSSSKRIKRSFLRGLADTDFSLTFKPRTRTTNYPVIYFQTYSHSLYKDTRTLLRNLGFRVVAHYRKSFRYDKVHDAYYIQISGRDQLDKWMKEVSFSSFNHITRYLLWKKLGKFPPELNINERRTILNKKAPPTRLP